MVVRKYLLLLMTLTFLPFLHAQELVYAEMEFPLSFTDIRQYSFNPLGKFQTQVEGRLIELSCDPLVDIYQITAGQQAYRRSLADFKEIKLRDRAVLNFNLAKIQWRDGSAVDFDDVWFSLEYRKLNPNSWGGKQSLILTSKGSRTFDAYFGDNVWKAPKPGEFYFPIVNKDTFNNSSSPREASIDKAKQRQVGYGRYYITDVEENRSVTLQRREGHPFYENLTLPNNLNTIDTIKMFAFPNARINRNEQFINGRVHLLTNTTQMDVGYIANALGDKVEVSRYFDDSFSSFLFNCVHPYLQAAPVRRALNYALRKELLLKRALGNKGGILISGPIPRRNFFYNLNVSPYQDNTDKALAILELYRYWGLDVYEENGKVVIATEPVKGPSEELQENDVVLEVERAKINSVNDFLAELKKSEQNIIRVKVIRGNRILVKRVRKEDDQSIPQVGILSSIQVIDGKVVGFPELSLVANNPEGKDPLIKQICGALKEDLEKIGIAVKIDYLDAKTYYPRLTDGEFDIAFRTVKITGTPSLYQMFFHQRGKKEIINANYGRYSNPKVNEMAERTRDVTEMRILISAWRKAHEVLHRDPPAIFLWSRQHILLYDPRIQVHNPGPEYQIPYGYTQINGLINIFNEVHLWGFEK